jgi:hypothetical protein
MRRLSAGWPDEASGQPAASSLIFAFISVANCSTSFAELNNQKNGINENLNG